MLSFHGLVIVSTDDTAYVQKDWGAFANTKVIVDNDSGGVTEYLLDIIVYLKDLQILKSKSGTIV